jgi:iron complex transport system substrate-binding protein
MTKFFDTTSKKIILSSILIIIIVSGTYGVYGLYFASENEPQTRNLTIIDKTGASVDITTPIERIVAIIGAEYICALGCQDKIVGRAELTTDEEFILPSSILDVPVVAETSFSVNLELILEQQPDLVMADEGLDDNIRVQIEAAGVPVLEESTTFPRRATFIQNLGLILDQEEKATEFLEYEAQYENLVKDRIANIAENEKPTVFFEWYKPWFTSCKDGSDNELIVTAGGINIAGNVEGSALEISPEFVAEANPDMIVRMLTFYDGEDLAAYQTLSNDLLTRPALNDTTAVKSEQVYIIKNTVLIARRPIGLLYLAKCFHPEVFADIDPAAIHEEYVQTFFGTSLSGVFVYP